MANQSLTGCKLWAEIGTNHGSIAQIMLPGKLFSHQYLLFKFPQTFLLWNWRNSFSWVGTDLCPLWNEKEGDRRGWQGLEISIPQEEYVLVPYANEAKQGHELYVPGNASYQILQSRCFPVSSLKKIDGCGKYFLGQSSLELTCFWTFCWISVF